MSGFITERNLAEAEAAFPGIARFYSLLEDKPTTFLDLLRLYLPVRSAGPSAVRLGHPGAPVARPLPAGLRGW